MGAEFKDRLIEAMKKKGILAVELAELTGISKARISQYVNGVYTPKSKATYRIAEALEVKPAWLMGYDVPMDANEPIDFSKYDRLKLAKKNETGVTVIEITSPSSTPLSTDEQELMGCFRSVNDDGKKLILANARLVANSDEYKKSDKNEVVG